MLSTVEMTHLLALFRRSYRLSQIHSQLMRQNCRAIHGWMSLW